MNNYYFTADKWYGPVASDFIIYYNAHNTSEGVNLLSIKDLELYLSQHPSGPSLIPQFAGMVKEEGKDFVFNDWFDVYEECFRIAVKHTCGKQEKPKTQLCEGEDDIAFDFHKANAEEGKQTFSEEERNNFAIGFAEWHNNLSPTQRCTVHPPAGSGSGYGLYNLSTEDLLKKYLKTKQ